MIVMAIIKLDDPVADHGILWRGRSEDNIPKNSAKPEASVRIFTMMVDMILVKFWKYFSRPSLVQDPMAKKRVCKSHFQAGKNCEIAIPKNGQCKQSSARRH